MSQLRIFFGDLNAWAGRRQQRLSGRLQTRMGDRGDRPAAAKDSDAVILRW